MGRRGRPKQSKAANLMSRLRDYADEVWRFVSDPYETCAARLGGGGSWAKYWNNLALAAWLGSC